MSPRTPPNGRPLSDVEREARRKRIARVAKRRGLVDIEGKADDAPAAIDDDDVSVG